MRISVVANIPEASSIPEVSTPPVEVAEFPFVGFAERQLREAITSQKGLTDEVFIILDEQTHDDGCTCRLVSRKQAHYFSVRSDFKGAQRSLDAILNESTNMQRLRNEAAMSGGILRSDRVPTMHMADMLTAVAFLNRPTTEKTWEACCKSRCGFQDNALIPVFCTTELPLQVYLTILVSQHKELLIYSESTRHSMRSSEQPTTLPTGQMMRSSTRIYGSWTIWTFPSLPLPQEAHMNRYPRCLSCATHHKVSTR